MRSNKITCSVINSCLISVIYGTLSTIPLYKKHHLFTVVLSNEMLKKLDIYPRANGAERRSGRKPGARVLIPSGYLHPGKRKH